MTARRILCVYPLLDPAQQRDLERLGEVTICPTGAAEEIAERIVDAEAVLMRGPARLTAEQIAAAPRLRVVAAFGAGIDNIDVEAATRAGVVVTHGAGVASDSVAEFVVGAMVVGHRRLLSLHDDLVQGRTDWAQRLTAAQGRELAGTTLGILGFGNIGREVARRAIAAFGVEVLAFDPVAGVAESEGIRAAKTMAELLEASDTVSLHLPKTPETIGLIGGPELASIGPQGVLIDAARGGILDEEALVEALRSGRLKGAVLDVFSTEPAPRELIDRLAQAPNLVLSPHVAGVTDLAATRLSAGAVQSVAAVFEGRVPERVANPQALEAPGAAP